MIFDQGAKIIQWGKRHSFQQMILGKLNSHMHKHEVDPYLIPYIKINSKWIKDLNYKILRRKHRGEITLDLTPKEHVTKLNFCASKDTINKLKRQPTK